MNGGLLNAVKKCLTSKLRLGLSLCLAVNLSCLILSRLDSLRTTSSRQLWGTGSARVIPLSHLSLRIDSGSHDHNNPQRDFAILCSFWRAKIFCHCLCKCLESFLTDLCLYYLQIRTIYLSMHRPSSPNFIGNQDSLSRNERFCLGD